MTCKFCGERYLSIPHKDPISPKMRKFYGGKKYKYWYSSDHACEEVLRIRKEHEEHNRQLNVEVNKILSGIL